MTVQVRDSAGATDQKTFNLIVNNTNDVPILEAIPDAVRDQDSVSYQLTATDVDANVTNETLTYEAVNTPDWMNVSSSGLITGTPSNDDVGSHSVTVLVRDSAGATDTQTFNLTVDNVNDAPQILIDPSNNYMGNYDADEGQLWELQLGVSDVDQDDSHKYRPGARGRS